MLQSARQRIPLRDTLPLIGRRKCTMHSLQNITAFAVQRAQLTFQQPQPHGFRRSGGARYAKGGDLSRRTQTLRLREPVRCTCNSRSCTQQSWLVAASALPAAAHPAPRRLSTRCNRQSRSVALRRRPLLTVHPCFIDSRPAVRGQQHPGRWFAYGFAGTLALRTTAGECSALSTA